jgi:hypothetical protein
LRKQGRFKGKDKRVQDSDINKGSGFSGSRFNGWKGVRGSEFRGSRLTVKKMKNRTARHARKS